jgi:hypothetical protein
VHFGYVIVAYLIERVLSEHFSAEGSATVGRIEERLLYTGRMTFKLFRLGCMVFMGVVE